MTRRILTSGLSGVTFCTGFILTKSAFSKIIAMNSEPWLNGTSTLLCGLLLIILSSRTNLMINQFVSAIKFDLNFVKWFTVICVVALPFNNHAAAQQSSTGFKIKNVEIGSKYITDSDSEKFRSYFMLLKLQLWQVEDIQLRIQQYRKHDRFGNETNQKFLVELAPAKWLSITAGYNQMPVGSLRLGARWGRFELYFGAGREAIFSRSNAITEQIEHHSAYTELSVSMPLDFRFEISAGRGRFSDANNLKSFTATLATSRRIGKFRLNLTTGYSDRRLSHFSQYYWSPVAFRELYFAPDLGFEVDAFWFYLNFSVDRVLEERYEGDQNAARSWGMNGEVSLGYNLGPGSAYLTVRYWNSAVQRSISSYKGKSLQASYQLNLH